MNKAVVQNIIVLELYMGVAAAEIQYTITYCPCSVVSIDLKQP